VRGRLISVVTLAAITLSIAGYFLTSGESTVGNSDSQVLVVVPQENNEVNLGDRPDVMVFKETDVEQRRYAKSFNHPYAAEFSDSEKFYLDNLALALSSDADGMYALDKFHSICSPMPDRYTEGYTENFYLELEHYRNSGRIPAARYKLAVETHETCLPAYRVYDKETLEVDWLIRAYEAGHDVAELQVAIQKGIYRNGSHEDQQRLMVDALHTQDTKAIYLVSTKYRYESDEYRMWNYLSCKHQLFCNEKIIQENLIDELYVYEVEDFLKEAGRISLLIKNKQMSEFEF